MQCSSLTSCSTFTPNYWAPNKCANCYKPESAHTGDGSNIVRRPGRDRTTLGRKNALDKKRTQTLPSAPASTSALPPQDPFMANREQPSQPNSDGPNNGDRQEANEGGVPNVTEEQIIGSGKKKLERKGSLSRMKHMVEKMVFKRKETSNALASALSASSSSLPSSPPAPLSSAFSTSSKADDLHQQQHARLQTYKLRVLIEAELTSQFPQRTPKEIEAVLAELEPHLVHAVARLTSGSAPGESDAAPPPGRFSPAPPSAPAILRNDSSPTLMSFNSDGMSVGTPPLASSFPSPASARSHTSSSAAAPPSATKHQRTLSNTSTSSSSSTSSSHPTSSVVHAPSRSTTTSVAVNSKETHRARVVYEYVQPQYDPNQQPLKDKVIVIHSMPNPEGWWKETAGAEIDGDDRLVSPSVSVKLLESHSSDEEGSPRIPRKVTHPRSRADAGSDSESDLDVEDGGVKRGRPAVRRASASREEFEGQDDEDLPEWNQAKKDSKSKSRSGEHEVGGTRKSDAKDRLSIERASTNDAPRAPSTASRPSSRGGSMIKAHESSTISIPEAHLESDSSSNEEAQVKKRRRKENGKKKDKKTHVDDSHGGSKNHIEGNAAEASEAAESESKRPKVHRSASTGAVKLRKKQALEPKAPSLDSKGERKREKDRADGVKKGRKKAERKDRAEKERKNSDNDEERRRESGTKGKKPKSSKSKSEIRPESENRTSRAATLF